MPTLPSLGGLRGKAAHAQKAVNQPSLSSCVVDCGVYVDGKRLPGSWSHAEAIAQVRERREGFVWIGLHEPDAEQIQGIAETFGLHELAVEDAVHAHQRPKLERYPDMLFMVLKTMRYVDHSAPEAVSEIVETGEIMTFLGKDFVVTVRHGAHSGLSSIRNALEADSEQLALGPAAVLHAMADQVVDAYLAVTAAVEEDIDEMETRVFDPKTVLGADPIYLMKREVLELRRAVMPLAVPLRRLAEGYTPLVPDEVRSYFRNVDDHLTTVSERVAGFDELLTTLVDATLAKISLQQNTDMRKITAWAAIIAVPTMIAGIYGMNFRNMPELHWTYGYPAALLVILFACLIVYRILRRNRWL
ncbi:MAG: magnesium and cobalt transport protein CorA [Sciscionella sp.]